MNYSLLLGDCIERLQTYPDNYFDSVVTDPPYDLTAGKKGGTGEASLNVKSPAGRSRISTGGFMGCKWDGTGIAFQPETWAAILRVLKPGGHLLAFGGTRTHHRQTCAIEDAGFDIRDEIDWLYATGFPKSLNIATVIDDDDGIAELWEGWGTALKPAREIICLARKPLIGTVAKNVLEHAVGGLNINGCRIDGETRPKLGRWPSNVIIDEYVASLLEEQHPGSAAFFYVVKPSRAERDEGCDELEYKTAGEVTGGRKEGSAGLKNARAGAGRTSGARNTHPTVKPIALMRYLIRLVTPPNGTVLDPFLGSGTTGCAAALENVNFVGIELLPDHLNIAEARIKHWEARSIHKVQEAESKAALF